MAVKGFMIQHLLIPYGVGLNMPPYLSANSQMAASDVFLTAKKLLALEYMQKEPQDTSMSFVYYKVKSLH